MDRTYISGIESGRRNPTLDVIERLAKGLDVAPAELFRTPDTDNADAPEARP